MLPYFMQRATALICSFCIFFLSTGVGFALDKPMQGQISTTDAKIITIPSATVVPVVLKYPLSSDSLQSNDLVSIVIDEDVFIDNHLVFKKGTSGVAYVDKVVQSGQHGRRGFISIKEGKIKDVNKVDHPVQLSIMAKGQSKRPSAVFLSVIGVVLILIPFGIWRTGTPATVSAAKVIEAFVTSPSDFAL